jgi:hypothetical protein
MRHMRGGFGHSCALSWEATSEMSPSRRTCFKLLLHASSCLTSFFRAKWLCSTVSRTPHQSCRTRENGQTRSGTRIHEIGRSNAVPSGTHRCYVMYTHVALAGPGWNLQLGMPLLAPSRLRDGVVARRQIFAFISKPIILWYLSRRTTDRTRGLGAGAGFGAAVWTSFVLPIEPRVRAGRRLKQIYYKL